MICGIGIDTVEIERFADWRHYSSKKLSRLFSPQEIDYCLEQPNKSAERFAVRFAAREALYKALSYAYPYYSFPFLTLCKHIAIIKTGNRPYLAVIGDIGVDCNGLTFHISFSHTRNHAAAFIVIEQWMI
jgi:phosphopantetheine--protein transferase-like protein